MKIAFIGFGEAARAFTDSLSTKEGVEITGAYDVKTDGEIRSAAAEREIRFCPDSAEAMEGADWIISAVTANQSLEAAKTAAPALRPNQVFIDINSVSPGRKRETATLIEAQDGSYLDMAVMAPVHPRGHSTPVLIAGACASDLAPELDALGFRQEQVGDTPGAATAIKMVRSLFVKGLEALTVEAALAATASGCYDRVIGSLAASYPGLGWPDIISYNLERTLKHGARRAAEMRESAQTLDALGLTGGLADRIADVQDAMGALPREAPAEGGLQDALRELLELRHAADGFSTKG
ncbi:NAD(P)-dependent oxidoreductase [Amorphus sp. 3PC139-8]